MTRDEFISLLKKKQPEELLEDFFAQSVVPACRDASAYEQFRAQVGSFYPKRSEVLIVGSGNWRYSLNPKKNFKSFDSKSDIDVAIVSEPDFFETWDALREYQRRKWYELNDQARLSLRIAGNGVYAGYVSPSSIPEAGHALRFQYVKATQQLQSALVGYRYVGMRFFRNRVEMIDYYKRGVMVAVNEDRHGV